MESAIQLACAVNMACGEIYRHSASFLSKPDVPHTESMRSEGDMSFSTALKEIQPLTEPKSAEATGTCPPPHLNELKKTAPPEKSTL